MKLGPTALPVLSPENYSLFQGLDINLSREILLQIKIFTKNDFGFRDLAFKEIKYLLKDNILKKASELTTAKLKDIEFKWHSPGIRAQLFNTKTNKLENDFVLIEKIIHFIY